MCERHGWHVQIFVAAELIQPLLRLLALPFATAIDHFGPITPDTSLKANSGRGRRCCGCCTRTRYG